MRAHHIGIAWPVAAMSAQHASLDEEGNLRYLCRTLVEVHTVEVVFHYHLRNVATAVVAPVVVHLVLVEVVEQREGIDEKVARTTGRVEHPHLTHILGVAHLMVRRIGNLVFLFDAAVGVHFKIRLAERVIYKKLHHPSRSINLALQRHLVILRLVAALLQCRLLHGVEVLVEPTKYVVALPYVLSTVSVLFHRIELLDYLIQFVGSGQQGVGIVAAVERNVFAEAVELVIEEMLQSLALRSTFLGVLLQPCVVLKRASCILLAPAYDFREELLRLHYLDGGNAVEEREDTLIDGGLPCFRIVVAHLLEVALHNFLKFQSFHSLFLLQHRGLHRCISTETHTRETVIERLLNQATYFENMIDQFHYSLSFLRSLILYVTLLGIPLSSLMWYE